MNVGQRDTLLAILESPKFRLAGRYESAPDVLHYAPWPGEYDADAFKVRIVLPIAEWTVRDTLAVHQVASDVGVNVRIAGLPPDKLMVIWR